MSFKNYNLHKTSTAKAVNNIGVKIIVPNNSNLKKTPCLNGLSIITNSNTAFIILTKT